MVDKTLRTRDSTLTKDCVKSRFGEKSVESPVVSGEKKCKNSKLAVLHHNICSLRQKTIELEVLLCSELKYVDVICLTTMAE
jgi:hypothetical protein